MADADETAARPASADVSPDLRRGRAPLLAAVVEALPGELFRVRLEDGTECLAHVSGKLRMGFTRLVAGTAVQVERSPFDPTKARILARVDRPAR